MTPTDYAAAIAKALEAGPIGGVWHALEHSWSDTSIVAPGFDHGICRLDINHATEESQPADEAQMAANANFIAACHPAALRSLLDERAKLTVEVERLSKKYEALLAYTQWTDASVERNMAIDAALKDTK